MTTDLLLLLVWNSCKRVICTYAGTALGLCYRWICRSADASASSGCTDLQVAGGRETPVLLRLKAYYFSRTETPPDL